MKNIYCKIEEYINNYPTKVRIYLSSIFILLLIINAKDIIDDSYMTIFSFFIIAPIAIYFFIIIIFKQE